MRTTFESGFTSKTRAAFGMLVAALLLSSLGTGASAGRAPDVERLISVIVRGVSAEPVHDAVESVGGHVTQDLPIIGGAAATVPESSLPRLRSSRGVTQVQPNAKVGFHGTATSTTSHRIQQVVNSTDLWNKGVTGKDVTVALLDTGVHAGHPDLQGANGSRVIACEDLSHERNTAAHCADTLGTAPSWLA